MDNYKWDTTKYPIYFHWCQMGDKVLTGPIIMHKSGVLIRKGTCDEYVPGQQSEYSMLDLFNKRVLDLGGHIGAFALYAIKKQAIHVTSVEPFMENCEMWYMNLKNYNTMAYLHNAAVVSSAVSGAYTQLYLCGGDTSGHSTTAIQGREFVKVPAMQLEALLNRWKPEVVKIDIEGSEYDLINDIPTMFPDHGVDMFAAELHLHLRDWRERAFEFDKAVSRWYDPVVPVRIGAKNWNTTGVWRLRGKSN